MTPSARIAHALGWLNLVFVGAVAAPATFLVIDRHGYPVPDALRELAPLALFVVGGGAVAVLLAALATYTRLPRTIPGALLVLADGPLFAALAAPHDRNVLDFTLRTFLVEGVGVWGGIAIAALTARALDRRQRLIAVGMMLGMLACMLGLFWPALRDDVPHTPTALAALAGGAVAALVVNARLISRDKVVRPSTAPGVMPFILVLLLAWVGAMGFASVRDDNRRTEAHSAHDKRER